MTRPPIPQPTSAPTPAPRSSLGCAARHVVEDLRRTKLAFDSGVRWFGRPIQLNWAHVMMFVIVPVAAVYMGRGLPTFYLGVLYFALMAHYAARLAGLPQTRDPGSQLRAVARTPILLVTMVFSAYAVASAAWSPDPADSLEEGLRLVGALVLMVPLICLLPARERVWHLYLPFLGLGLAAIVLLVEFGPVPILRERLYNGNAALLNRGMVIVEFLLWPTLAVIAGRWASLQRIALTALCAGAVYASISQTSMLAFATGALAALVAFVAPRLLAWLIGVGTVVVFAAAPLVAPHLGRILHVIGLDPFLDQSSQRRLEIWQAFSDVIWQRPVLGWGIKSSSDFGLLPIANVQWVIGPAYHPHNMLIQTWTELGAVGVVLVVTLVILLTRAALRLPTARRPYALAGIVSGLSIAAVSHGMWQSWWICLILAGIAIFSLEDRVVRRHPAA